MTNLLSALLAAVLCLAIGVPDVEAAKRIGGGRSVGTQRQSVQQQTAPTKPAQPQQQAATGGTPTNPAPTGAGRWLGPVAGLLAGGLLGALLFGGAFEGFKFMDFALILLLAGAIFFIFKALRRPAPVMGDSGPMRYAGVGGEPPRIEPMSGQSPQQSTALPVIEPPASNYFPAGFDAEGFARQAKLNFVRLQEANDRGDLSTMRDVMTPGLYQEIEAQLRERGSAAQKIEVVTLQADVVEVVTQGAQYIASVRFSGTIREDAGQPESFGEVWHLEKPASGSSGWLLAGIQQD
jgi:predicted lipid-binding transport protein (Tim44 family)